jgi:RNA polymerase sigma-70 factor (ECF subfamily)
LHQALAEIPATYRRIFTARFLKGLSTRQEAKLEQIPVGSVLSRVFKAKRLLRQQLEATP